MKKKAVSPYVRGRQIEYQAKYKMLAMGAKLVVRSARSKGPVDLVAFFPERNEIWIVQVKVSKNKIRDDEIWVLRELAGNYRVVPVLFYKLGDRYVFERV